MRLENNGQAVSRAQQCPQGAPHPEFVLREESGTWLRCPYQGVPGSVFIIEIQNILKGQPQGNTTGVQPVFRTPAIGKRINDMGKCTLYIGEFQKQVQNNMYSMFPML